MAASSSVPVIASGGIGCMADLLSLLPLEPLGVSGVIVGRALYDGRVDLAEAVRALAEPTAAGHHSGLQRTWLDQSS